MKKLLVLALVLGLVSLANAWVLEYSEGVVTATAESTDTLGIMYLGIVVDSAGDLENFAAGTNAPSDSVLWDALPAEWYPSPLSDSDGELWAMSDQSSPWTYNVGVWLTADLTYTGTATVSLYQWLEGEPGENVLLDEITVPEPATIALLCLGGLLLRKK